MQTCRIVDMCFCIPKGTISANKHFLLFKSLNSNLQSFLFRFFVVVGQNNSEFNSYSFNSLLFYDSNDITLSKLHHRSGFTADTSEGKKQSTSTENVKLFFPKFKTGHIKGRAQH